MNREQRIEQSKIKCQLLNMDLTLYKEFDSLQSVLRHLGIGSGMRHYKAKNKPYQVLKHRETKEKYYLKIIN